MTLETLIQDIKTLLLLNSCNLFSLNFKVTIYDDAIYDDALMNSFF